jgi:hypothetical protein
MNLLKNSEPEQLELVRIVVVARIVVLVKLVVTV